jgi:epoxide hydrolase
MDDDQLHPFRVQVPQADMDDLRDRLARTRWPGAVVELLEVIGPLVDPRAHGGEGADAFHLVVPSIPGFGFSGPTREPGWEVPRIAGASGVHLTMLPSGSRPPSRPRRSWRR